MQAHIQRELNRHERETRDRREEAEYQRDLAEDAQRDRERAYCARAAASFRAGESEEAFEAREAAAIAAEYRITDRVNREIVEIFAAAGIASERFFAGSPSSQHANDRRAA